LLTTADLRGFLENTVAALCDLLQVRTGFVAVLAGRQHRLEAHCGDKPMVERFLEEHDLTILAMSTPDREEGCHFAAGNGFWLVPLHSQSGDVRLGVLGIQARADTPDLPPEISAQILRGGAEVVREAGAVLAGGHTIQDKERKYGLIVLGFVDPGHMLTKGGAQPGDLLALSKPLGFGTTTTAIKRGLAAEEDIAEVVGWMKRLNRGASELAREFGLHGGTDITGFSLLGHAAEMAEASGVRVRFSLERIPLVSCARRYADEFIFPGGSFDNRLYFSERVRFAEGIDEVSQLLLFDEATSYIDSQTELMIQQALAELMENRTALVIAHRLSTVRNADRILVLHRGRIIESGTHADLIAAKGFYFRLHQLENGSAGAPRPAKIR